MIVELLHELTVDGVHSPRGESRKGDESGNYCNSTGLRKIGHGPKV